MLVALALVLRAKPLLALRLSEKILSAGQQYASQQRLPFLLWALSQASRCPPDSLRLRGMQATASLMHCFSHAVSLCWRKTLGATLLAPCQSVWCSRTSKAATNGSCMPAGRSQRWGWLCGSEPSCHRCWGSRWRSPPLTPLSDHQVKLSETAASPSLPPVLQLTQHLAYGMPISNPFTDRLPWPGEGCNKAVTGINIHMFCVTAPSGDRDHDAGCVTPSSSAPQS